MWPPLHQSQIAKGTGLMTIFPDNSAPETDPRTADTDKITSKHVVVADGQYMGSAAAEDEYTYGEGRVPAAARVRARPRSAVTRRRVKSNSVFFAPVLCATSRRPTAHDRSLRAIRGNNDGPAETGVLFPVNDARPAALPPRPQRAGVPPPRLRSPAGESTTAPARRTQLK